LKKAHPRGRSRGYDAPARFGPACLLPRSEMDRLPRMRPTSRDPWRSPPQRRPPRPSRLEPRVVVPPAAIWCTGWWAYCLGFVLFERIPAERLPTMPAGLSFYRTVALADLALRLCVYVPIAWIVVCSWKRCPKSARVVLLGTVPALLADLATRYVTGMAANTSDMGWFVYSRLLFGLGLLIDDFLPVLALGVGLCSALLWICLWRLPDAVSRRGPRLW
jgi:hypothetical protein